ncbi:C40 family peptidase [Cellulomonas gilvus]|uniref:NLP/P60 protein n=1 Tax=Cellulomonas gilvus (strain ATCC 13127 / NRRL B-14078) TaxID=593907 RepID=F8A4Q5_CELGA|nr:C40 family peptidase [Cellulomonas gilvus]AEI10871.1 NLP/P60 protein [Cellulomonas gilvus ATCC 13127]
MSERRAGPRPRVRRRVSGALTLATAAALLVGAPGAFADPGGPSDQDVQDAREAVRDAEQSVAQMEIRLAQLSTQADAAERAVQQAGEAYTQALAAAEDAQGAADDAAQRSSDAAATAEQARRELVAIARQVARSGGSADLVESLLSAEGFEDVARRTSAMDQITGKADEAVQAYRAADLVAGTLSAQAQDAAATAADAQADAQTALDAAQDTADDADAARVQGEQEREALLAQLAAARSTSVEVERERQEAIDEERRRREEREAREEHEQDPDPEPTTPSPDPTTPPDRPDPTTPPDRPDPTTPPDRPDPDPGPTTPPAQPTRPPTPKPDPTKPSNPGNGLGTGVSRGSASQGATAVAVAKSRLGAPYVWGGTGPGYDCSGLTMTSWSAAGVGINRTSRDQYKQVLKISYSSMRPGDLVFWGTNPDDANSIYHVAMYIGGGQIIEALRPGLTVRITSMRYYGAMPYAGRP